MQRLPSTTALQMFVAAARDESFVRAAERLNVTQAAISKQIKQLEATLDVPLFERQHRRVLLTERGTQFLAVAESVLSDLTAGTGAVFDQAVRPTLHVEIDFELMTFWLAPRLSTLKALLPEVDLRFSPPARFGRRNAFEAEIAIVFGRPRDPGLIAHPLMDLMAVPVCTPQLRATLPDPMRPEDFLNAPLIHDVDTTWWDDLLGTAGVVLDHSKPKLFIGQTAQLVDAALSHAGIIVGDDITCRHRLETGDFVRISDLTTPGTSPFFVARSRDKPLSSHADIFLDWLQENAREQQRWLEDLFATPPA